MLWVALLFSSVILLATIGFAWFRDRGNILLTCGLGFFFCGLTGSIAILLQCSLTAVSTLALRNLRHGFRNFTFFAVLSMIVGFAVVFAFAFHVQEKIKVLQQEYPVISLETRLPNPPRDSEPYRGDGTQYEFDFPDKSNTREIEFRRLHDKFSTDFVNSPGFGLARFPQPPSGIVVQPVPESVPQPVRPLPDDSLHGEILTSGSLDGSLTQIHNSGIVDFVNQAGFGYFKNRNEVTGFRPHRFSKLPDGRGRWAIQSVELVSLLKHVTPAVYLSDNLPRMDQLADVKTRPLMTFEREGLDAIRKGELLYARDSGDVVRMIGAIRSARACVDCHGGSRGDLLGAFSYCLKK